MLVYWIHYKEHDDPYTQGYVGITNNLERRLSEHSAKHSKCHHVKNRINNDAIVSVLHHVESIDEAQKLEEKYRPVENIGWNICKGGGMPPQANKNFDTNRLIGEDRTEAQKESSKNHSIRMKGKIPWNKGVKGQVAWNKGIPSKSMSKLANTIHICPHCKKEGRGSSMLRWHFDNCKYKVD